MAQEAQETSLCMLTNYKINSSHEESSIKAILNPQKIEKQPRMQSILAPCSFQTLKSEPTIHKQYVLCLKCWGVLVCHTLDQRLLTKLWEV